MMQSSPRPTNPTPAITAARWTPSLLQSFEADIAAEFNASNIKAPIHLSGGNELQLISYFEQHFRPGDWTCSNWRSHYHALLVGVPPHEVKQAILRGRSITLTFPQYNFISSAIVGGILPIAVGLSLGLKRAENGLCQSYTTHPRVHCFLGDMTARTGAYHEAYEYASGHDLPINFVVEDNGKSVGTPTHEVWPPIRVPAHQEIHLHENPHPHAGSGVWIKF